MIRLDRMASRAAAQDDRVAALQAQRHGVGRDVGAALVDHRDHAERHARAHDLEPVRAGVRPPSIVADRVGQRRPRRGCPRPCRPPGPRRAAAGRSAPGRCGRAWRPPRPCWFSRRISSERRSRASAISASTASRWRPGRRASTRLAACTSAQTRSSRSRPAIRPRPPSRSAARVSASTNSSRWITCGGGVGHPLAHGVGLEARHRAHLVGRHGGDALAHAGPRRPPPPPPRRRPGSRPDSPSPPPPAARCRARAAPGRPRRPRRSRPRVGLA